MMAKRRFVTDKFKREAAPLASRDQPADIARLKLPHARRRAPRTSARISYDRRRAAWS